MGQVERTNEINSYLLKRMTKQMVKDEMNIKKIREAIIQNRMQIQSLITTRDSLLPKLMLGEIRVPIEEVQ